jgi:hypothetical protein
MPALLHSAVGRRALPARSHCPSPAVALSPWSGWGRKRTSHERSVPPENVAVATAHPPSSAGLKSVVAYGEVALPPPAGAGRIWGKNEGERSSEDGLAEIRTCMGLNG